MIQRRNRRKLQGMEDLGTGTMEVAFTFAPIEVFETISPYPSEAPVSPSPTQNPTPLPTPLVTPEETTELSCPLLGGLVPGIGCIPCFSSEAMVQVEHDGLRRMEELQLGDKVLTKNGRYESIYSFGHYDSQTEATYLQFAPSNMELSPLHLIFTKGSDTAVPASQIKVGDVLSSGQAVSAIRSVQRRGAYAPFTASGTIVVNDELASSFVSLQGTTWIEWAGGWSTGISAHTGALAFEAPHRLYSQWFNKKESYTADGRSTWVAAAHDFFHW
eukprot:CAMPEP_0178922082 /NCGR_PEP_ID=MMETSP0786-20121207/15944_1 /TAXON_ID=186022 /ORGANISM="Thalassionema frauenfeldii, Strain CCMP 1798" /LENGTH=272 /DNA_ID=CAMNT_0020596383 /DNA_START=110 /DNA_END=925 /DNA_ORIENTATION=+